MRILFVVQKLSCERYFKQAIESNELFKEDAVSFACNVPVFHIDDNIIPFHEENGKIHGSNGPVDGAKWLELSACEVPEGTYFEVEQLWQKVDVSGYDIVVGCPDYDDYGILGFQKFVEKNGVENAKFIEVRDLSQDELLKVLTLTDMKDFGEVFGRTVEKIKENEWNTDIDLEDIDR